MAGDTVPIRMRPILALSLLVAALVLAAPASADIHDAITFGPPANGAQSLTVTFSDTFAGAAVHVVSTYRQVPPTTTVASCPDRLADNHDTRLVDATTPAGAPYSIGRSVSLPLQLFTVCNYRRDLLSSDVVGGTFQQSVPGGGRRAIGVGLTLFPRPGHRARFAVRVIGLRSGRMQIQRRVGRHWRTRAHGRFRHGKGTKTLGGVRRGQHWRVRVSATKRTRAGTSPVIDIR
jgi:hypothetical protein